MNRIQSCNTYSDNIQIEKGSIVDNYPQATSSSGYVNTKTCNTEQFKRSVLKKRDVKENPDLRKLNSNLSINAKKYKNNYWNITKNVQVSYAFGKNVLKNIKAKKNKITKATPTIQQITPLYVDEREWFKKKCEREIGAFDTRKEIPISRLDKCLRLQELLRCSKEICMYREYEESPRPDNVPDVVWRGPLMRRCGCPKGECECKGNMLLPPKRIEWVSRYTWHPMYYLRALTCFKKWQPPDPPTTFAQRLQVAVDAEADAYKKLREMGLLEKRGAEFCIYRCFFYQMPQAESNDEYFTRKQQFIEAFKNNIVPPPVVSVELPVPVVEEGPIIDGFYRSLSTQSDTGPNGEFIMGKISHVLFAKMDDSVLCDIEGKELNIHSYKELQEISKPPSISTKLDQLFSLKGIRSQFSKLTSNFISSIIEIKDTGIPVNSQGTQDPPLNDNYQSVIEIPLKEFNSNQHDAEKCPCCKFYKTANIATPDVFEQNTIKNDLKMNESSSDPNPQSISTQRKKVSIKVKKEKVLEGVMAEKFNNIMSSSPQKDIPQHDVTQTTKFTDNELTNNESSMSKENKNNNNKLSSLSQDNRNNNETTINIEKLNDKIRNNICSIDQKTSFDNVNTLNNPLKMYSSNDANMLPDNEQLHKNGIKFGENKSDKDLLTQITNKNIEKKLEGDVAIAENKTLNKGAENSTDLNENFSSFNKNDVSIKHTIEEIPNVSIKMSFSKNQNNFTSIEENCEKRPVKFSKTDIHMLLNNKTPLNFNSTQKPSIKNFPSKNSQRVDLRNRVKKALSYNNIKLHVKRSFQKTSSAFSEFFKCVDFTSGLSIKQSKDQNNIQEASKHEKLVGIAHDDFTMVSGNSDKKDSKISEEEMFSLQYNSNLMTDTESSGV